jgi:hypothetical protein
MASEKSWLASTIVSAIDMSGSVRGTGVLYKAVTWAGNIAATGSSAAGLLQYGARSGQQVTVGWHGEMQYIANAAIVAGMPLSVTTSGYLKAAASGDLVVGRNSEIAATSGSPARGQFNFANAWRYTPDSYTQDGLFGFATAADLTVAGAVGKAVYINSGDFHDGVVRHASGVLVEGATSGGTAKAIAVGPVLVRAGNVVTAGRNLTTSNSGHFIHATSGTLVVGKALAASAAGNSGGTFLAAVNFATPHWATSSEDVTLA